ncbi:MAG: ABC transporter permease [Myxococcales bacterium]
MTPARVLRVCAALAVLLVAAAAASASFGSTSIDLGHALSSEPTIDRIILLHDRLPRTALAVIVGAALAVVGVAFQALVRNPLADPFVLGTSGGAALGATASLVLGLGAIPVAGLVLPGTPLLAFAGAAGALALVYGLASFRGRLLPVHLLLIGVVFNFFASAVIMFLKTVVAAQKAQEMLLWLMGSLSLEGLSLRDIALSGTLVAGGIAVIAASSGALNVISLGDEGAAHLGVDLDRVRRRIFVATSLMVGAAVSVSGLIGFVGLVVPHALRLVLGPDHRLLVPASALAGAALLVLCDLLARLLFPVLTTEAPVGVLTAFIGGPVFVWLLVRTRAAPKDP